MKRKISLASNKASRAGYSFRIVTMGIGSVDRHELDRIATRDENTYIVHAMSELHGIRDMLMSSICLPEGRLVRVRVCDLS